MKKIRVLFYRSKLGDGHLLDNAISAYTGLFNWFTPPYSHCEIWTGNYPPKGNGQEENAWAYPLFLDAGEDSYGRFGMQFMGDCLTSTMRGDYNGVVKRPARDVLHNPYRWDYVEIEIEDLRYFYMVEIMKTAVKWNKGYDKPAIAKFFNPFARQSTVDQFICSEFVQWALYWAGVFDECLLWSPRRLWKKLIETTHLPTYNLGVGEMIHDGCRWAK